MQLLKYNNNNNNGYASFDYVITYGIMETACNDIDSSGEHVSYIFNVIDDSSQEST